MIIWAYHKWITLSRQECAALSFTHSIELTLTGSLKEMSSPNKGIGRWLCQVNWSSRGPIWICDKVVVLHYWEFCYTLVRSTKIECSRLVSMGTRISKERNKQMKRSPHSQIELVGKQKEFIDWTVFFFGHSSNCQFDFRWIQFNPSSMHVACYESCSRDNYFRASLAPQFESRWKGNHILSTTERERFKFHG